MVIFDNFLAMLCTKIRLCIDKENKRKIAKCIGDLSSILNYSPLIICYCTRNINKYMWEFQDCTAPFPHISNTISFYCVRLHNIIRKKADNRLAFIVMYCNVINVLESLNLWVGFNMYFLGLTFSCRTLWVRDGPYALHSTLIGVVAALFDDRQPVFPCKELDFRNYKRIKFNSSSS